MGRGWRSACPQVHQGVSLEKRGLRAGPGGAVWAERHKCPTLQVAAELCPGHLGEEKTSISLKFPSRASALIRGRITSPGGPQRCWSPGARRVTLYLALKFVSAGLTQLGFCSPVLCRLCGLGGIISGLCEISLSYSKRLVSQSLVQGSLSMVALVRPKFRLLFGTTGCWHSAGSKGHLVAAPPTF